MEALEGQSKRILFEEFKLRVIWTVMVPQAAFQLMRDKRSLSICGFEQGAGYYLGGFHILITEIKWISVSKSRNKSFI